MPVAVTVLSHCVGTGEDVFKASKELPTDFSKMTVQGLNC